MIDLLFITNFAAIFFQYSYFPGVAKLYFAYKPSGSSVFFLLGICVFPACPLSVYLWIWIHPPPKTDRGKRSPDVIYSLNTSCSFQSPRLTCLLRWVPVGPVSVDCAGEICEMEQTRLETQKTETQAL